MIHALDSPQKSMKRQNFNIKMVYSRVELSTRQRRITETCESWIFGFLLTFVSVDVLAEVNKAQINMAAFPLRIQLIRRDLFLRLCREQLFVSSSDSGLKVLSAANPQSYFAPRPVVPGPASEHDLGSEVLLLGGVVTHAHLQHPF